jgi:SAM-dependent methyltransferase
MIEKSVYSVFFELIRPAYLRSRTELSKLIDKTLGVVTTNQDVALQLKGTDVAEWQRTFGAFGWTSCWRVLRQLQAGPSDVFLDIGSGAGRMACAAARFRFGRVIGLEISPALVELAKNNILSLKGRQSACEMLCTDALHYVIPEDVTIIFMYNPFEGSIFESMLRQIVDSYDRKPRRLRLVYANPREHHAVVNYGRFRLTRRILLSWRPSPEWKRTQTVQIYEIIPQQSFEISRQAEFVK